MIAPVLEVPASRTQVGGRASDVAPKRRYHPPPLAEDRTATLLDRAASGDPHALDALAVRFLPRLRAFVRLRMGAELRDREESMDVVQSVFRELVEHQDGLRYDCEPQFVAWLFTTALNKVRQKHRYHRRECRERGREHELDPELAAALSEITPSRDAAGREQVERLQEAFAELPDDYREVIALSRIVGLSHREIAVHLDRSEVAVRKLLGRALVKLAVLMEG
jgi:RNA polymerase sigma-70 factor (ECF subfamily)